MKVWKVERVNNSYIPLSLWLKTRTPLNAILGMTTLLFDSPLTGEVTNTKNFETAYYSDIGYPSF